jgi:hypothetical protein
LCWKEKLSPNHSKLYDFNNEYAKFSFLLYFWKDIKVLPSKIYNEWGLLLAYNYQEYRGGSAIYNVCMYNRQWVLFCILIIPYCPEKKYIYLDNFGDSNCQKWHTQ